MQALQLTRPSSDTPPTLNLLTLPIPQLSNDQILIKIHASAIHPSDLINSKGLFPLTSFPRIPGRDFSGTVVAPTSHSLYNKAVYGTSGNTQAFSTDGAQAEYIAVSPQAVTLKPSNLSFTQAATIGVPFTTASLTLKKASLKKGETVLVLGANGAVGNAVVQLAKARGARVLRATRSDDSDVNTAKDTELTALDALTNNKGVDIVIDTVGFPSLTAKAVQKLGRDGRLVFIAAPKSGSTEVTVEMLPFYRAQKSLIGINSLLYSVEEMAEELEVLRGLFESGKLVPPQESDWKQVNLKDGVEAYKSAGERGAGKFVIVV